MDSYNNYYAPHREKEYYVDRGFVANDDVVKADIYWNQQGYPQIHIIPSEDSDWYKTLMKIIEYCKTQGVELTFVVAPLPEWTIVGKGNYQEWYDYMKNIADEHGVEYYDFNLCNPKYFDANDRTLFKDEDHLNTRGAEKLSKVFVDFFRGKIPRDALFYDSLEEKLDAEEPYVFGFAGLTMERKGRVISNRVHGMEYRLEVKPKAGIPRVIQEYSEEKEFTIPSGEHGKLVLTWRMKEGDREGKIEAEY